METLRKGQVITSTLANGEKYRVKIKSITYRNALDEFDEFFDAVNKDKFLSQFEWLMVDDYNMFNIDSKHPSGVDWGDVIVPKQYAKCVSNELWNLSITPFRDGIEIYRLEVKGEHKGHHIGVALLNRFHYISAKLDIPLYVKPGGLINGNNISKEKRDSFYAKNGFEKPKGDQYWNNKSEVDLYWESDQSYRDEMDAYFAELDAKWTANE